MFEFHHLLQLQQLVQSLQMQQQKPQPSLLQALDAGLVVQLQALTAQLTAAATANSLNPLEQRVSSFNKVNATSITALYFVAFPCYCEGNILCVCCRNSWALLILEMILNAAKNQKRRHRHLRCMFLVFYH